MGAANHGAANSIVFKLLDYWDPATAIGTALEINDQTQLPDALVITRFAMLEAAAHAIRAFDVTFAPLITGLITKRGVCNATAASWAAVRGRQYGVWLWGLELIVVLVRLLLRAQGFDRVDLHGPARGGEAGDSAAPA